MAAVLEAIRILIEWVIVGCVLYSIWFFVAVTLLAVRLGRFRPHERLRRR